jgi:hypothetical protein
MFHQAKVLAALEEKKEAFTGYDAQLGEEQARIRRFLAEFQARSYADLARTLGQMGDDWPGAQPTPEWDQAQALCLPFGERWSNHQEARQWAMSALYKRPSLAVDGSQITPTKDFSVPVGAVQIGWFVNEHCQEADLTSLAESAPASHISAIPLSATYVKDIDFTVLSPGELDDGEEEGEGSFPNWRVNQQRFVGECAKLCELMEAYAQRPFEQRPLCFFDGSFIISFAGQLRPERAAPYLQAVRSLLQCSETYHVPLVGFVDSAYSRDLVTLVNLLYPEARLNRVSDAGMVAPLLRHWGDRTPLFVCARKDQLSHDGRADFYRDVVFCYMRLVQDRPPARLELPRWLLEHPSLAQVMERVQGECVVGGGYPYAIETADAVAVISQPDRERFYRLFQQFLARHKVPMSLARKMRSKRSRR